MLNDYYLLQIFKNFKELNTMIVQDLKRIPNGYENGKKLFEITSIHTNLVYGEFNFRFLLDSTYKTIGNTRQQQISMLDFLNTKH